MRPEQPAFRGNETLRLMDQIRMRVLTSILWETTNDGLWACVPTIHGSALNVNPSEAPIVFLATRYETSYH